MNSDWSVGCVLLLWVFGFGGVVLVRVGFTPEPSNQIPSIFEIQIFRFQRLDLIGWTIRSYRFLEKHGGSRPC
jgi:hypothetical protein